MTLLRPLLAIPALVAAMSLSACAGSAAPAASVSSSDAASEGAGHGAVAGAAEVAEPPLGLLSIDVDGGVGLLDLLSGETSELGTVAAPTALASDGRYGFATTDAGVEIVDAGRWSWNHGDHFHYYLAEPRLVGTVAGDGAATVTWGMLSTAGSTGIRFADSGEAVLIDNAALSDGEVVETFRVQTESGAGVIAPLHEGALVSEDDTLVYYDATGEPTDATAACTDASGAITTVAALAIGCAEGAVLATWQDGAAVFEQVPYPGGPSTGRATAFDGRKGRPTVAALAGTTGFWLLDTREAAWQHVATTVPLVRVTAVDDVDAHVVALDAEGRVHVFGGADAGELAVTDPLVAGVTDSVSLTVDGQRAYLNDPATGTVLEIDVADGARIARTLETPTAALFVAEVGR